MRLSIIIPTYNEGPIIASTIRVIRERAYSKKNLQIIVSDGNSTDQTVKQARAAGATIITASQKRRSVQMNEGAEAATGEILYFLHADTIPPLNFDKHILNSINQGNNAGCFGLSFDQPHFLLRFYSWCTQFDIDLFRFGDQSLFINANIFKRIGAFREDYILMEDQEIVKRVKKFYSFTILPQKVITSSRKYTRNGILKLQVIFILLVMLYKAGAKQPILHLLYLKLVQ